MPSRPQEEKLDEEEDIVTVTPFFLFPPLSEKVEKKEMRIPLSSLVSSARPEAAIFFHWHHHRHVHGRRQPGRVIAAFHQLDWAERREKEAWVIGSRLCSKGQAEFDS